MKRKAPDPTPETPDWNLHISAMVSPTIRAAIVTLVQAAHADQEELANLKRMVEVLNRKRKLR